MMNEVYVIELIERIAAALERIAAAQEGERVKLEEREERPSRQVRRDMGVTGND